MLKLFQSNGQGTKATRKQCLSLGCLPSINDRKYFNKDALHLSTNYGHILTKCYNLTLNSLA